MRLKEKNNDFAAEKDREVMEAGLTFVGICGL
jgi:hypothetical protein